MGLIITVADRGAGVFSARAEFRGVPFEIASRSDVSGKLIRILVEAGLPDQRYEIRGEDGRLRIIGRSTAVRAGMKGAQTPLPSPVRPQAADNASICASPAARQRLAEGGEHQRGGDDLEAAGAPSRGLET